MIASYVYVIYPPSSKCSLPLRSADTGQLYVPRTRTILGERAFAVARPRACMEQSISDDGAVYTVTVYIQVIFEHISFSLRL